MITTVGLPGRCFERTGASCLTPVSSPDPGGNPMTMFTVSPFRENSAAVKGEFS